MDSTILDKPQFQDEQQIDDNFSRTRISKSDPVKTESSLLITIWDISSLEKWRDHVRLYLQIGTRMALVNLDAFADKKNGCRSLCVLNKCISQSKMLKSVKDVSTSTLNSGSNGEVILYRNVRSKLIDNSETFLRHKKFL